MSDEAIEGAVITVWAAILVAAIVTYLVQVTRDAALGRSFRLHMGSRESAWKIITTHRQMEDAKVDERISRGMRGLSDADVDELFGSKRRPIEPHEFRVTERAKPIRFDDDKGAA